MAGNLSLIEAMKLPSFYPGRPSGVEFRQTHISYVFLAGDFVYKVKKPVRFNFLDYSSLEQRRLYCHEEVRLNRRLAGDVYLSVLPILERGGEFTLGEKTDQPANGLRAAEYAVKMRRLPEERMLDALVRVGGVEEDTIDAITHRLVSFHATASTERAELYGTPEEVWRRVSDNFRETEKFLNQGIPQRRFDAIEAYSRQFVKERHDLLMQRIKDGWIREGHGDLRAEHICLTGEVLIFDCIEFDERLRYCDVASELAFLAMDLDFLGAPGLSRRLVESYATLAGDKDFFTLLPFYESYRAYVRAKVECLKCLEPEVPPGEQVDARAKAGRYARLSHRYTRGLPRPAMIIVCGMVGTGKSTLANTLRDLSGFDLFRSDTLRKRLAGVPETLGAIAGYRSGLYSDHFTEKTYSALLEEARRSLDLQRGVIVDATFRDPAQREHFVRAAGELGVRVLFLECQAREEEILKRLREREKRPHEISDATVEIYLRQRQDFVPFSKTPGSCHLKIDTEADLDDELERVERWLYGQRLRRN